VGGGGISVIVFHPGHRPGLLYRALSGHKKNAGCHSGGFYYRVTLFYGAEILNDACKGFPQYAELLNSACKYFPQSA
jgi:hypothetical protein